MKANVGSYDAALRFVTGCGMLIAANRGQAWGLAGFAFVASAFGFCPCYWLLRFDTLASERRGAEASRIATLKVYPRSRRKRLPHHVRNRTAPVTSRNFSLRREMPSDGGGFSRGVSH